MNATTTTPKRMKGRFQLLRDVRNQVPTIATAGTVLDWAMREGLVRYTRERQYRLTEVGVRLLDSWEFDDRTHAQEAELAEARHLVAEVIGDTLTAEQCAAAARAVAPLIVRERAAAAQPVDAVAAHRDMLLGLLIERDVTIYGPRTADPAGLPGRVRARYVRYMEMADNQHPENRRSAGYYRAIARGRAS